VEEAAALIQRSDEEKAVNLRSSGKANEYKGGCK